MSSTTLNPENFSAMSADLHQPRTAAKILDTATAVLNITESGKKTLDDALDQVDNSVRRSVEHLLLSYYRHKKSVTADILKFCKKSPRPEIMQLLSAVLTQCRFQSAIPPQSAVNIAVEKAKAFHASGFVNAVMRRLLTMEQVADSSPQNVLPDNILKRWRRRFDDKTLAGLTKLFLSEAPFSFRLLPGSRMPENCTELPGHGQFRFASGKGTEILSSDEFKRGDYYIQDPAASFAVSLAENDAANIRYALDICAAPGGKSLMLWELLPHDAHLLLSDISANRQKRTAENFSIRNRKAEIITARPEELNGSFDCILADVPCSNSGVFRRRPDALWRFDERSLKNTCSIQRQIISQAHRLLNRNGILIVSSCSIEPEENSGFIDDILAEYPDFVCEDAKTLLPSETNDGAFAARLRRV